MRGFTVASHAAMLIASLRGFSRNATEDRLYRRAVELQRSGDAVRATMKARLAFRSMLLRTAGREWKALLPR